MYMSYDKMKEAIENRVAFNGNSVTAIKELSGHYVVYSYSTKMLRIIGNDVKYFNNKKYSATTSKLQNMIIDIFSLNDGIKRRG